MKKWEYKRVTKTNDEMWLSEINKLGQDGWEMVSHAYGLAERQRMQLNQYHFKRELQDEK